MRKKTTGAFTTGLLAAGLLAANPATAATPQPDGGEIAAVTVADDGTPTIIDIPIKPGQTPQQAVEEAENLPHVAAASIPGTAQLDATNDPYTGYQWNLTKTRFPQTWPTGTGEGQTVAVIDTGVDLTHPDLAGQTVPGADTSNNPAPMSDPIGHGTHVAGVIAAAANNNIGIAGAAPGVKIMPVKVFEPDGTAWTDNVAAGVIAAADAGASVINLSLGTVVDDAVLEYSIQYARSRGSTVVASAGNDKLSGNPVRYPAAYPGVVGVGATDQNDNPANFSNTGPHVDIAAPGVTIPSLYPAGRVVTMNGTSAAAPHVSAAAALVRAANPSWTAAAAEAALLATARDINTPGRDDATGAGLLQADTAVGYTFPAAQPVPARETIKISTGAPGGSTVFGNLTAVTPEGAGWVTAWPCNTARPLASNLNFQAGVTTANYLAVATDPNGDFCVYASNTTHLLFDQTIFSTKVQAQTPVRKIDTRETSGGARPVPGTSFIKIRTGAPGGSTVFGNLTAVTPEGAGWVTAWPCNTARPLASNLNFQAGVTTANYLAVATDPNGDFCVYASNTTHLLFDQTVATGTVKAVTPVRKIDTRQPAYGAAPLPSGNVVKIQTGATSGKTVFGNLTAVNPEGAGWVAAWPCSKPRPNASNLNYQAGVTRANYLAVETDPDGSFCVYTTTGTHVLFDQNVAADTLAAHTPARKIDTRIWAGG